MRPHVSIRPQSDWEAVNLTQLWRYREVWVAMAKRDLKLRYRQTVLGAAWVIIQPLLGAGIFSFVFGAIAGLHSGPVPYFVFSYAGLLAWNAFNTTLIRCSGSLLQNAGLVSKVFFPRLLLPFSTVASTLIDFTIGFLGLLVLLVAYAIPIKASLLLLPCWLFLLLAFAVGTGTFLGALAVRFRDVNYILPVAVQLLLYASPVAYSIGEVPERFHAVRTVFLLNPLAPMLDGFRAAAYGQPAMTPWWGAWYAIGITVLVFMGGVLYFARVEREFADVI